MLTRATHRFSIHPLPEAHYLEPHRKEISARRGEVADDDPELSPSHVFFPRELLLFAHRTMMSFDFLPFNWVWLYRFSIRDACFVSEGVGNTVS